MTDAPIAEMDAAGLRALLAEVAAAVSNLAVLAESRRMVPHHLKTAELATRLGVTSETLLRAKDRGEVKPIRIGRDLLWPEPEVARWLESKTIDYSKVRLLKRVV